MKQYRATCECGPYTKWEGEWWVQPAAALEELSIHVRQKHHHPQNLEEREYVGEGKIS